jgi:hypothetical protein
VVCAILCQHYQPGLQQNQLPVISFHLESGLSAQRGTQMSFLNETMTRTFRERLCTIRRPCGQLIPKAAAEGQTQLVAPFPILLILSCSTVMVIQPGTRLGPYEVALWSARTGRE